VAVRRKRKLKPTPPPCASGWAGVGRNECVRYSAQRRFGRRPRRSCCGTAGVLCCAALCCALRTAAGVVCCAERTRWVRSLKVRAIASAACGVLSHGGTDHPSTGTSCQPMRTPATKAAFKPTAAAAFDRLLRRAAAPTQCRAQRSAQRSAVPCAAPTQCHAQCRAQRSAFDSAECCSYSRTAVAQPYTPQRNSCYKPAIASVASRHGAVLHAMVAARAAQQSVALLCAL
jgi:hypothetical protein